MARTRFNPIAVALVGLALIGFLISPFGPGLALFSGGGAGVGGRVTHVVLFQWKKSADPDAIVSAHNRMMALSTKCLHPRLERPYILSFKGGRDHSPEGLQNGATHGYVVEFASVDDRDYYVKTDPAHQAFIKSIGEIVEKATVLDFTDGLV